MCDPEILTGPLSGYINHCFLVTRVNVLCHSSGFVDCSFPTYRPSVNVNESVSSSFQSCLGHF